MNSNIHVHRHLLHEMDTNETMTLLDFKEIGLSEEKKKKKTKNSWICILKKIKKQSK